MDHALPWRQRWGLWLHVSMCKYCLRFGRQIMWLRTFCRQYTKATEDEAAAASLSFEARQRIKEHLTHGTKP